MLQISKRLILPSTEIQITAMRSQGPGGQNVNKVASAVHLRFDILNSSLPQQYKDRLLALRDRRITKDGVIILKVQQQRNQKKNREIALNRLKILIQSVMTTKKNRIATSPTKGSRIKRLEKKTHRGKLKILRQKIDTTSMIFVLIFILCSEILPAQSVEADQEIFSRRRTIFMSRMDSAGIAILPGKPVYLRNLDVEFPYRQESNFYYLSGYEEPESALLLDPSAEKYRYVLFVRERNKRTENWTGIRSGTEGAMMTFQADTALPYNELQQNLRRFIRNDRLIYYTFGINPTIDAIIEHTVIEQRSFGNFPVTDPAPILNEMRLIKNEGDWESGFRKAIDISICAQQEAFRAIKPGMYEYEIQAIFEYIFRKNGSPRNGYSCIIGSGPNALILHYQKNQRQILDDDLIVMDCAAEYGYYSADITRTVPANGRFTQEQRDIYQIVLEAQKAGIAIIKPGSTLRDISDTINNIMAAGLIRLGLIKDKSDLPLFSTHGYCHWLGLDVHDVGAYKKNNRDIALEPGMVFTIEPGLYIRRGIIESFGEKNYGEEEILSLRQRIAQYLTIGIRIEDDILVTDEGCRNLTEAVPREIGEIEALMAEDPEFVLSK